MNDYDYEDSSALRGEPGAISGWIEYIHGRGEI